MPSSSASRSQPQVPVVQLADYRSGSPQARARFVQTFGDGLKEFGFVTVADHGVDLDLIRRVYTEVEQLFRLPASVKDGYVVAGGGGQRGLTRFGTEHAKNRTVGDLKEFWHVGRDLPAGHRYENIYTPNVWPKEIPAFKPDTLALFHALEGAALLMLQAIADYFGLPRTTFSDMAHDGNSILRLIHYPPLKEKFVPGAVRAAEHEDINLITLLCEGTASGLEILTRDGQWLPVDTLRGQIVVDSGDMLSRVTNNVIPSTTHRVVNPQTDDVTRYSLPFFVHPYGDCVLEPLPLGDAKTPRAPAITADAFLHERLKEIGLVK